MARTEEHALIPDTSSAQAITPLTRRKLFDCLARVQWWGALDEVSFLSRLYDLKQLPSTDSRHKDADGDIRRHRFANEDWDDGWVFGDDRFDLQNGPDDTLLRFLSAMLHPDIRDTSEAKRLALELNSHLSRDGWELYQNAAVSGYPTYSWRKRPPSTIAVPSGFPTDAEGFVASVAELLRHRAQNLDVALLAHADFEIAKLSYDNWDGGTWGLTCAVEAGLYAQLTNDDRAQAEVRLLAACGECFRQYPTHSIDRVVLAPRSTNRANWRPQAMRWLLGEGVNNQGRVRSDNVAALECDGLHFRSNQEIHVYRALKRAGVTFAPLPVFVRGGREYARLEPDFVIIKDGNIMVVEVDGGMVHRESPADAHQRLQPLDHEGAQIERIRADDCDTPDKAQRCVDKLLRVFDAMTRRR